MGASEDSTSDDQSTENNIYEISMVRIGGEVVVGSITKEQYDYWKPESVIIEGKASGLPLTYEMRKLGIPVINFTPSRGNDKHTRVNSVAPLFEAGQIWAPDTKFAEEVIEECAAFPLGEHDDLVDSMTQAVMRFRQGGFVDHPDDYEDEALPQQQRTYY